MKPLSALVDRASFGWGRWKRNGTGTSLAARGYLFEVGPSVGVGFG